jgi:FkbM family methyltransferase
MLIINSINNLLNKIGVKIIRYPNNDLLRRIKIINYLSINKIIDVGADTGKYSLELRTNGFKGDIIMIEPLSISYRYLTKKFRNDVGIKILNIALGDFDGNQILYISKNHHSSSLLKVNELHTKTEISSSCIGQEEVKVFKMDTIFKNEFNENDKIFLKIDAQGFEKNILEGGALILKNITCIQLELSIEKLYEDSFLYDEIIIYLNKLNYKLVSLEPGFFDQVSGRLLQFDGIFIKSDIVI